MEQLTHINSDGYAKMVSVEGKAVTTRTAIASGEITMRKETLERIKQGGLKKGDVLTVAQIAGITGAKRTSDLIPMCHNISLDGCDIAFEFLPDGIKVTATVTTEWKTGVEMEALTAVSVGLLTVYDMVKAIDKTMVIGNIKLEKKTGGKSDYERR